MVDSKSKLRKCSFCNKEQLDVRHLIVGDDGNDYFFHETGLSHEIYVKDGDKVEFKVVQGDRGDKAVDISIID